VILFLSQRRSGINTILFLFSGTLQKFIDVLSARVAVGHDKDGRVVIVQIDGKTSVKG
jgi:exopolysaccharide biosynthesis protein